MLSIPLIKRIIENTRVAMDKLQTNLNERDMAVLLEAIAGTVTAGFIICIDCAILNFQVLN